MNPYGSRQRLSRCGTTRRVPEKAFTDTNMLSLRLDGRRIVNPPSVTTARAPPARPPAARPHIGRPRDPYGRLHGGSSFGFWRTAHHAPHAERMAGGTAVTSSLRGPDNLPARSSQRLWLIEALAELGTRGAAPRAQ